MHVKAGVAIEPSGDRGMFMGGVIVGDDVDVEDILRKIDAARQALAALQSASNAISETAH